MFSSQAACAPPQGLTSKPRVRYGAELWAGVGLIAGAEFAEYTTDSVPAVLAVSSGLPLSPELLLYCARRV